MRWHHALAIVAAATSHRIRRGLRTPSLACGGTVAVCLAIWLTTPTHGPRAWSVASALCTGLVVSALLADDGPARSYLWSRPLPRSAIFAGRLVVALPLVYATALASRLVPLVLVEHHDLAGALASSAAASATVTFAAAALATWLTSLASDHALPLVVMHLGAIDLVLAATRPPVSWLSVHRLAIDAQAHGRPLALMLVLLVACAVMAASVRRMSR